MRKLILPLIIVLFLTSCATHQGMISSSALNRPVKYEDIAYGVSQTNQVLGLGGLSKDALILEAKRELINNRPLKQNETYANFTVDFKRSFFPFYNQTKATMSADVVSFTNDPLADPYTEKYKQKLTRKSLANELFEIGDSVYINYHENGVIVSIENIDKVRVLSKTASGNSKTKLYSTSKIYTKSKDYKGYKVGDMYIYSRNIKGSFVKTSGRIIALGLDEIIVKTGSRKLNVFNY
ncbi:hypothetical protein DWB61_15860 [Ancylomarina euxinus]|uniref:Lipoprotein n=1 Tax=Ancylomarina euxinus TaxID=2283627 RepID=A0A425XX80_9BACT|nr:DUF6567 family protein [Ancylomarina euxinus]MCZ4696135.1 hypothetical protein [Ancylomarina euxinus]MUP16544.1 hypothetical protein [Ancylomarina euxinus]RRG19251.1 hypothetical protein DWB61_15860 [Ancylomarina euxinus]